jgi:hypothetical protein
MNKKAITPLPPKVSPDGVSDASSETRSDDDFDTLFGVEAPPRQTERPPTPQAPTVQETKKPTAVRRNHFTQAERILHKFGGAKRLAYALRGVGHPRHYTAIRRWALPKERGGRGGTIPATAWKGILLAAKAEGILLSAEDMDPRPSDSRTFYGTTNDPDGVPVWEDGRPYARGKKNPYDEWDPTE